MVLDERDEGDYRICAGALGGELGEGYVAAVVICRIRGTGSGPREAFRNEALAGGYRWPSPETALCYAIGKGVEAVRMGGPRLAC